MPTPLSQIRLTVTPQLDSAESRFDSGRVRTGEAIALERVSGAFVRCDRDGRVLAISPLGTEVLARIGVDLTSRPIVIVPAIWREIVAQAAGARQCLCQRDALCLEIDFLVLARRAQCGEAQWLE